jgi:hypothetical protein
MKYKDGDNRPYAWRTSDYGQSWSPIAGTLPEEHFVRVIREDTERKGLLFAGMERGLFVSFNSGDDWQPLQTNLPVVPITDLMIRRNDLVLATQGRAFWVLDDIAALRQFDVDHASATVHLYAPSPAYRLTPTNGSNEGGASSAASAPDGAVIYYSLAQEVDLEAEEPQELKIEILDADDELIRTLKTDAEKGVEGAPGLANYALPAQQGLNRAVWDLRTEPTTALDYGVVFGAGEEEKAIAGYRVAPGKYTVRLSYGDVVEEQTVDVTWDPINSYDNEKINEQQAFLAETHSMIDALYMRIASLQAIRKQVELRKALAEEADDEPVIEAADALLGSLETWQKSVSTPERETFQDVLNFAPEIDAFLVNVYQQADSAVLGLTRGQHDRLEDLQPVWQQAMDEWDKLMSEDLPAFNQIAGPAAMVPDWE